jgi:hypothetical protein
MSMKFKESKICVQATRLFTKKKKKERTGVKKMKDLFQYKKKK